MADKSVYIKDLKKLNWKIEKFRKSGKNFLHVVSDFDKTLTKAFVEGQKIQSSYEHLRKRGYLTSDYAQRSYDLKKIYYPFEISKDISAEEKHQKMREWWAKHYDLMVECGLSIKDINSVIEDVVPRDGMNELFGMLNNFSIPFLIFSSGMGDLIREYLSHENLMTDNVHLISNFFRFDKDGRAVGYNKPLIHVFNKSEIELKNYQYHKEIQDRKNVILLGDSLGDLGMTEGIKHDCIIRIGFLNENADDMLEKYSEEFDVVILNDGSMEYVIEILRTIVS